MSDTALNPSPVLCRQCGQPILYRRDLVAMGRSFVPIHANCLHAYKARLPWFLRGMPMNRASSFLIINAASAVLIGLVTAFRPETSLAKVALILLVANAWMLLGRVVCYFALERHIPSGN